MNICVFMIPRGHQWFPCKTIRTNNIPNVGQEITIGSLDGTDQFSGIVTKVQWRIVTGESDELGAVVYCSQKPNYCDRCLITRSQTFKIGTGTICVECAAELASNHLNRMDH